MIQLQRHKLLKTIGYILAGAIGRQRLCSSSSTSAPRKSAGWTKAMRSARHVARLAVADHAHALAARSPTVASTLSTLRQK